MQWGPTSLSVHSGLAALVVELRQRLRNLGVERSSHKSLLTCWVDAPYAARPGGFWPVGLREPPSVPQPKSCEYASTTQLSLVPDRAQREHRGWPSWSHWRASGPLRRAPLTHRSEDWSRKLLKMRYVRPSSSPVPTPLTLGVSQTPPPLSPYRRKQQKIKTLNYFDLMYNRCWLGRTPADALMPRLPENLYAQTIPTRDHDAGDACTARGVLQRSGHREQKAR